MENMLGVGERLRLIECQKAFERELALEEGRSDEGDVD